MERLRLTHTDVGKADKRTERLRLTHTDVGNADKRTERLRLTRLELANADWPGVRTLSSQPIPPNAR